MFVVWAFLTPCGHRLEERPLEAPLLSMLPEGVRQNGPDEKKSPGGAGLQAGRASSIPLNREWVNVRPEPVLRRETGAVEPVIGPERHPEEVSLGLHVGWLLHAAMTWNLTIRRREI